MPSVKRLGNGPEEYHAWRRWMRAIGTLREDYFNRVGSDPLAISEAATVGLMLTAAGKIGLIGLLEYPTEKRPNREKGWCYGRCDLWVLAPRHTDIDGWAFEVKHRRLTPRSTKRMLVDSFRAAWTDAGKLDVAEASMRLACTVFHSEHEIDLETSVGQTLTGLAERSDWAWRISHDGDLPSGYFLFKQRRRGNRY